MKKAVSKNYHLPKPIKQTLEKMLSLDVQKLPTLEELRTIKDLKVEEPKGKRDPPKKNEGTTRAEKNVLTVEDVKKRLDNFMTLDPKNQRQILGELLYPKVLERASPKLAPRITGMLVDFEVLTIQDIIEMLENQNLLEERIQEAKELLEEEGIVD